jgi:BirA family biotin operon repressor/biotin-[acetyl-CoA-carboxylase] ligase
VSLAWQAEALWEQLEPLLPGLSVEVVASSPSTNSTLLERARADAAEPEADDTGFAQVRRSRESAAFGRRVADHQPCLLVAEHQTQGRGRLGRAWVSSAGASLTFSLSVAMAPRDWSGLSLAVGVALADALEPGDTSPRRIGLKWPNDLWLMDGDDGAAARATPPRGRKLGGILIETRAVGTSRMAVVGVGLNVMPQPGADELPHASLQELDPGASAPQVLSRVALPLVRALLDFERDGFAGAAERFAARDLLRGHAVLATTPGREGAAEEGVAMGVSGQGALRVRAADGTVRDIDSGEVSVRFPPEDTPC